MRNTLKILLALAILAGIGYGEDKRLAQTAFKILVGPFVQPADKVTPVTALNVANLVIDWYQPYQDSTTVNKVINGDFTGSAANWTLGAGWTYAANALTATTASSAVTQGGACIENVAYTISITITRTAGTLTPSAGGTAGSSRATAGTFAEPLVCGATGIIALTGAGFTGTLDNVSAIQGPARIAASATLGAANYMRHVGGGIYELNLTAVQTAFPGTYRLHVYDATQFAPVWQEVEIQAPASFGANLLGQLSTATGVRDLILSDGVAFPGAKVPVMATDIDELQTRNTYVSRKGVGRTWPMQFYQQASPTLPIGPNIQPICTRARDNLVFQPTTNNPTQTNPIGASEIVLSPTDMTADQFVWLRCTVTGAIAYGWVFSIQTP